MAKQSRKKIKNKTEKNKTKKSGLSLLERNLISLVLGILVIFILYKSIDGYKWLWDNIIYNNLKTIEKHPDLSNEQKWALKLGFDFRYLNFIKKNTPENAIILMPPDSVLFPKDRKSEFSKSSSSIKNKAWSTYFVYPRKIVYEYELDSHPLAEDITHIAIANYWGYDYLNYVVKKKQKHQILPITQIKETEK